MEEAIDEYNRLNETIHDFLGTEMGWDEFSVATLFDLPLGKTGLSHGQSSLLQYAIAFHAQAESLKNLIIFMDEPEKHLHPQALIYVIDKLIEHTKDSQIWIATHSLSLIAHLVKIDPAYLWLVKDGNVSFAGNNSQVVLKELVGDEYRIGNLIEFVNLPEQHAITNFSLQCLIAPESVMTGTSDPQMKQVNKIINDEYISKRKRVTILDFGAGKGRLPAAIYDSVEEKDKIKDWLDYIAYDTQRDEDNDGLQCKDQISKIYDIIENRYYTDETTLLSKKTNRSIDIIVMCNVFHEIDPAKWNDLFKSKGIINTLLKDDGVLLIVEVQKMMHGEKAHKNGFIVFDSLQFKELFKIDPEKDEYKIFDERNDGRLKAHLIPKKCISNYSEETKREALNSLMEQARDEIKKLRRTEPNYRNGTLHAFWTFQLANARLALDEIESR